MHLLISLRESNLDIRLLWTSVFVRMAGYGLTNQVLTLYLEAIGVPEARIGLFMTLTLLGDTIVSYVLTWYAEAIGRRTVMILGSVMMMVSGFIFAWSSNYIVLLVAAILGVISPSGDETGPFKSVEEASIAHLTPHNHRPEIFAFYGLFSTAGAALGSVSAGFLVDYLGLHMKWDLVRCYKTIFVVYGAIAVLKIIIMLCLSQKCEIGDHDDEYDDDNTEADASQVTEHSSLLTEDVYEEENSQFMKSTRFGLSPKTAYYLPRLLAIFMLDSLGYGFMPSAWVVYYFKKIFAVSATGLGLLFFWTNAIDAISSLPSAFFAKLLGPVKAILFTQAPSAVFLMLIAATNYFGVAAVLYFLYCATSTMDVVPRQVLLTSIMNKREITKVMGIVNIGKTFARCVGPIFTGKLAEAGILRYGFVINGACVLLADLLLATNFLHLDAKISELQKTYQQIQ